MISTILTILGVIVFGVVLFYKDINKKPFLYLCLLMISAGCFVTSKAIVAFNKVEAAETIEYKTEYILEEIQDNCFYGENTYNEISVIVKNNQGFYDTITYDKEMVNVVSFTDVNKEEKTKDKKENDKQEVVDLKPTITIVRDVYYDEKTITIVVPDVKEKHKINDTRLLLNDMVNHKMKKGYSVFMDGEMKNPETFRAQTVKLTGYAISSDEDNKEVYIRKNWTND